MTTLAVSVAGLSKAYRLGIAEERHDTLAGAALSWLRAPARNYRRLRNLGTFSGRADADVLWALRDVSFDVAPGEVVGIIGRNGAGKSTLLKILSQITEPTAGRISIHGRVASLLEVGTGFHPELTGRENVYLNGTILGMRKAEIDRKFDEIVEFSGVERFLDTPVKRYSSGMQVRLAFSVAAHLEPEILVVDEVLAVGDAEFQAKCLGKMRSVSESEHRTVLFVSHNMTAVKRLCQRCVLLHGGKIETIGNTQDVIRQYMSLGASGTRALQWDDSSAPRADEIAFHAIRVTDRHGLADSALSTADDICIEIDYSVFRATADLRITIAMFSDDGVEILSTSDYFSHEQRERKVGGYSSRCTIPGGLLNVGRYTLSIDADIPRVAALIRDVQLSFDIEELAVNHLGVTLSGRPGGLIHPDLPWRTQRRDLRDLCAVAGPS